MQKRTGAVGDPEEEFSGEEKSECGLRLQFILETGRIEHMCDMQEYAIIQCVKYSMYKPLIYIYNGCFITCYFDHILVFMFSRRLIGQHFCLPCA